MLPLTLGVSTTVSPVNDDLFKNLAAKQKKANRKPLILVMFRKMRNISEQMKSKYRETLDCMFAVEKLESVNSLKLSVLLQNNLLRIYAMAINVTKSNKSQKIQWNWQKITFRLIFQLLKKS